MKKVLQLEEVVLTVVALYALSFYNLDLSAWIWAILFFSPDISLFGYMVNAKIGALTYNLCHHKGAALLIVTAGYFLNVEVLMSTGIVLFAHASFDRILGYGLKYITGFKHTHLGSLETNMGKPIFQ